MSIGMQRPHGHSQCSQFDSSVGAGPRSLTVCIQGHTPTQPSNASFTQGDYMHDPWPCVAGTWMNRCIPVLASNCYLLRLAVSQTEPLCPNMTSVWVAGMSPQTHPVCVLGPAPTRCMDMDVTLGDSSCVRVATCPNRQQQDPPRRDARNTCAFLCLQNTAQHGAHI